MRAAILHAPGDLRIESCDAPRPGPGELLIRVRAATTCGTDLKAWRRGHPQIPMPGAFGHEYSGDVIATGDGAPFAVGQPVMGVHSAPCQACRWCRADQENLCESIMATKVLGAYAEQLLIPARIARLNVFPKPDGLDYAVASLLEPFACVAQGMLELQRADAFRPAGDVRALVIGPGAIGLMFVTALRRHGVASVTLAGRNPARLEVGAALGAQTVPYADLLTAPRPDFDVVIECTGMPEVWEQSVRFPRRGGTVMLFGGCASGTTVTFDTGRLHYDQITLLSPFHFGTRAVRLAREWLLHPDTDLSPLLTRTASLDELPEIFAELNAGIGLKAVIQP
ncbi:MAG: alcohol dehydrogenase catalytic domain-containing protein [Fimbriimonadaceae bacterium]|nr:alcohol dehydrogenase catalytic domain-containing protein [Fimbriimonadaceae bacterium]